MNDTSALRQLVSAAIDGLTGWTVSRWSPDLFGRDTDHMMHHAFVVSVPETSLNPREQRQRVTEGLLVESVVEVSWAHRLRGDAQSADYSTMLDDEQDLVGVVRAISTAHILVERMSRRAVAEGWILGTVRFRAIHRYALT